MIILYISKKELAVLSRGMGFTAKMLSLYPRLASDNLGMDGGEFLAVADNIFPKAIEAVRAAGECGEAE